MKNQPTPRQADARRRAAAFGDSLRAWLHDRATAAKKQREKAAKKAAKNAPSRGVDRVPERLRVTRPDPEVVHLHEPAARGYRWVKGTPYRNPDRIQRLAKSGRLRKELLP